MASKTNSENGASAVLDTLDENENENEDTSAPLDFDAIIAAHGASISGGRVFPDKFGPFVLGSLAGDVTRVVIALPVAPFEDATMLDTLDTLDGCTVLRTLIGRDGIKAANTRSTVKLAADKVKRSVHLVTLRNAAGTSIAVSVTNNVSQ